MYAYRKNVEKSYVHLCYLYGISIALVQLSVFSEFILAVSKDLTQIVDAEVDPNLTLYNSLL